MNGTNPQRWVLSFADLIMLLLAFFVLVQAQTSDRLKMAAGIRGAFGGNVDEAAIIGFPSAGLFEPGEAILKDDARIRFVRIGRDARAHAARVVISAQGRDDGSARLDSWELAAARTAAVGRAIRAGGVTDDMIEIAIPPMRGGESPGGQRISVRQIPK